jgi:ketosteroid isomerase-like protein
MRTRTAFIQAAVLLAHIIQSHAFAADGAYSQSGVARYIQESEAAWAASVATNDSSVVQRILADDVVWILDGRILDKAQAVAGAARGPHVLSNHPEYANVRFFGDVAVVQGSESWTRQDGQKGRFVWMDTWVRRKCQWQIVTAEDVSVSAKD